MAFHVLQETRANALDRDPTIWVLEDDAGNRLEVWPALGFNAYRWLSYGQEILYRDPAFFDELKPSRSGWPILFPFPNRIRDGAFTWDGQAYRLQPNDPSGKNAIHGFAASRPWRVIEHGADEHRAWVTGEFQSERDAKDVAGLWPGEYCLRITYSLTLGIHLRVEASVENTGATPLPFGLGYHPYFRVEPFGGDEAVVNLTAGKRWELIDCLPTGAVTAFSWQDQRFGDVELDHLFTAVAASGPDARECGALQAPEGKRLAILAARDFRDLVVFTPPHRQAICFEPYTCITDAINVQSHGFDAGLQVLAPGGRWRGWVQAILAEDPTPAA